MIHQGVPVACPIGRSAPGTHGHFRTAGYTGSRAERQADPLRKPTFKAAGRTAASIAAKSGLPTPQRSASALQLGAYPLNDLIVGVIGCLPCLFRGLFMVTTLWGRVKKTVDSSARVPAATGTSASPAAPASRGARLRSLETATHGPCCSRQRGPCVSVTAKDRTSLRSYVASIVRRRVGIWHLPKGVRRPKSAGPRSGRPVGRTDERGAQDCLRSAIHVNGCIAPAGVMCSSRSWLINSH